MKKHGSLLIRLILALVLLITTVSFLFPSAAWAQSPPPDRPNPPSGRPDLPPDRTGLPSIGVQTGGGSDSNSFIFPCSTVYGVVLNMGYRGEGKLPVQLIGPDWQTTKITDDNGHYASDCLGAGVGLLNAQVRPGVTPLTVDIALRLGYQANYEVNLGLYSGNVAPPLPVTPLMDVSRSQAKAGDMVIYTIRVAAPAEDNQNLWDVIITDLLPAELIPMAATSTMGNVEIWGNLLTADIGHLEPGQEAVVSLSATVQEGVLPGTVISNRASLIYQDNLAVQTLPVEITIEAVGLPLDTPLAEDTVNNAPLYLPETGAACPPQ